MFQSPGSSPQDHCIPATFRHTFVILGQTFARLRKLLLSTIYWGCVVMAIKKAWCRKTAGQSGLLFGTSIYFNTIELAGLSFDSCICTVSENKSLRIHISKKIFTNEEIMTGYKNTKTNAWNYISPTCTKRMHVKSLVLA